MIRVLIVMVIIVIIIMVIIVMVLIVIIIMVIIVMVIQIIVLRVKFTNLVKIIRVIIVHHGTPWYKDYTLLCVFLEIIWEYT